MILSGVQPGDGFCEKMIGAAFAYCDNRVSGGKAHAPNTYLLLYKCN